MKHTTTAVVRDVDTMSIQATTTMLNVEIDFDIVNKFSTGANVDLGC